MASSFRSNASCVIDGMPLAMTACLMTGMEAITALPMPLRLVGTSRQPSSTCFDLAEVVRELVHREIARRVVLRQEAHGHGIIARLGQVDFCALGPVAEQLVRNLDQDARAIAQKGVCAHGAAMVQVQEDLEALGHDSIGLLALHIGDEADATGVVLIAGIVETLCRGKAHFHARKLVHSVM